MAHFLQNVIGVAAEGVSDHGRLKCACRPTSVLADVMAAMATMIPQTYSPLIPVAIERERSGERHCWTVLYYVDSVDHGTNLQDAQGEGPQKCKDGTHFYKEATIVNPYGCILQGEVRNGTRLMMSSRTALRKVSVAEYEALDPEHRFRTNLAHFQRLPDEIRQYPKASHYTVCGMCRAVRINTKVLGRRIRRKRGDLKTRSTH